MIDVGDNFDAECGFYVDKRTGDLTGKDNGYETVFFIFLI
jgi:hypothetical protein